MDESESQVNSINSIVTVNSALADESPSSLVSELAL